ncbi:hypothetical protein ALC60_06334 [Trachymyrmex zeteki]|uniref:Uncharacterized protein n=1 Tax=Mycetomoellerius zeteki TaxID=64791 RepID=A0A151X2W8_9HYME|nr:hypothetical protein ALC60_06334 [Trachymyrmex zeteki]
MSRKSGSRSSTLSPLVFHVDHHVRTRTKRRRSIYSDRAMPSLSVSPKPRSPSPRVPRTNARRHRRSYRSTERMLGYQQSRGIPSPNPVRFKNSSGDDTRRGNGERRETRDEVESENPRDASPPDGNSCFATRCFRAGQ